MDPRPHLSKTSLGASAIEPLTPLCFDQSLWDPSSARMCHIQLGRGYSCAQNAMDILQNPC